MTIREMVARATQHDTLVNAADMAGFTSEVVKAEQAKLNKSPIRRAIFFAKKYR